MDLERIIAYGFMTIFVIGNISLIFYSVIVIIISGVKNHKMDKEIMNSMSKKEREFRKRIWH